MKGYRHLTAEQRAAIPAAYQRMPSVTMVARQFGVSDQQIRNHLRKLGVPLSRSHEGACYRHIDLVRQLAAEGTSLGEIARRVGTKHQTVAKFLRLHQIPYTPFRQSGPNNPAWKGGRVVDKDGYILIWHPDHPHADRHGYVREHRLVMERVLGRYLLPTEVVDHIDGVRDHNDDSNLQLFASNRDHLAATLQDRVPNWTPGGKDRLRESFARNPGMNNSASQRALRSGVAP
jgi:transposase-like protein